MLPTRRNTAILLAAYAAYVHAMRSRSFTSEIYWRNQACIKASHGVSSLGKIRSEATRNSGDQARWYSAQAGSTCITKWIDAGLANLHELSTESDKDHLLIHLPTG